MVKYSRFGKKTTSYRKRRATGRVRRRMTSIATIPRIFPSSTSGYPPLPARMHIRLRCSNAELIQAADGVAYAYTFQQMHLPRINTGAILWAGGFLSLMELYSKAIVKKVYAVTRFESTETTRYAPMELVCAVVPWSQQANYAGVAAAAAFDRLKTNPFSHTHQLGRADGGFAVATDTHDIDVEKFLGQPLTNQNAILKDVDADQLTTPSAQEQAPMPSMAMCFRLAAGQAGNQISIRVHYDWYYHVEFSDLRDLPNFPNVGTRPWVAVPRAD